MKAKVSLLVILFALMEVIGTRAQVPPKPLTNVKVKAHVRYDTTTGVYWYEYEITNPPENEIDVSGFYLDISVKNVGSLCCWDTLPGKLVSPDTLPPFMDRSFSESAIAEKEFQARFTPVGAFHPPEWGVELVAATDQDFMPRPLHGPLIDFITSANFETTIPDVLVNPILPGMTQGGFQITSYYPPGIRDAAVMPDVIRLVVKGRIPKAWYTDPGDTAAEYAWKQAQKASLGMRFRTVGPRPLVESGPEVTELLLQYHEESVTLGWLIDTDYAADLRARLERIHQLLLDGKMADAEVELVSFLQRLDEGTPAQRTDEAYAVLYYNARELLEQVRSTLPLRLKVTPGTLTRQLGETAEITAELTRGLVPVAGESMYAMVVEGPHEGRLWTGETDARGQFVVRYSGRGLGMDKISICPGFPFGEEPCEPEVVAYVKWKGGPDLTIGYLLPQRIKLPHPTGEVTIAESTINLGIKESGPTITRYYLSADEQVDATDAVLGERAVPSLTPQKTSQTKETVTLPSNLAPGVYQIIACADADDQVAETNEANNCAPIIAVFTPVLTRQEANRPPDCSTAHAEPDELWPPNHQFHSVAIEGVTDPDGDDVNLTVTGVESDEVVDAQGGGDGHTCPDASLSPLEIRAERQGGGNGRVYVIHFQAEDGRGGTCTGTVTVCVPHDQRPGSTCIDDGTRYDMTQCANPAPSQTGGAR